MPVKANKTLKYNYGKKSLKAPFAIYTDLECLLVKKQSCQNNPAKPYTERKVKYEPSGYTFKHIVYRGKDCIDKFCKDLKELATKIINYDE